MWVCVCGVISSELLPGRVPEVLGLLKIPPGLGGRGGWGHHVESSIFSTLRSTGSTKALEGCGGPGGG